MLGPNGAGKTTMVVLPAPLGPSIAIISPYFILRSTDFNALKPLSYTLDKLFIVIKSLFIVENQSRYRDISSDKQYYIFLISNNYMAMELKNQQ